MPVPPAQIGLDNLWITLHFLWRAFCNLVADAHHQAHIVLDQQDRYAAGFQVRDRTKQFHAFGHVHAGRRFIEQQHVRFRRERSRNLQQSLLGVRQLCSPIIGTAAEADDLQRLSRAVLDLRFILLLTGILCDDAKQGYWRVARAGNLDVFDRAQVIENPDGLKCTGKPKPCDSMWLKSEQLLAVDLNRTSIGMRGAAECIEQCGLAGSVRSDDRQDNAARNVEIDTIQRDEATEPFGHATRGEDRAVAHRAPASRSRIVEAMDARPPGARTITAMTPRP